MLHQLILYPKTRILPFISNIEQMSDILRELQFIGDKFATRDNYLVGDKFFQHIIFLGCSPFVQTSADTAIDDVNFCHISLVQHPRLQFVHSLQLKPPNCPQCQQIQPNWHPSIQAWRQNINAQHTCLDCGHNCSPLELLWSQRHAAFIIDAIHISGIFAAEAIPSDEFLSKLQLHSQVAWHYCYANISNFT